MDDQTRTVSDQTVENHTIENQVTPNLSTNWVRSTLSGTNGMMSTARLCVVLVVCAAIGWVTYLVCKNNALPDLTSLTIFVGSVITSVYTPNKITEIVKSLKK